MYDISAMHREFQLITCEDAMSRYQIHTKIYESEAAFLDMESNDSYFYIHTGDLHLQGDFVLDTDTLEDAPDGRPILGFLIIGNLEVEGSILNETGDYGPILYVAGNVSCRHLLIGGSPVRVTGNISAAEVIMLHYNHGWMQCDGTFTAPVMIVEDYYLMPAAKDISLFYYNDRDPESPADNACEESEDGDDIISPKLRALLNNTLTTDFEELRRDLAAGESVLQRQEQPASYWQQKVRKNWHDLKRVPLELRTQALCEEVLRTSVGALAYFPEDMLTPELAAAAVAKDGKALRYLPSEMITRELCYAAARNGAILRTDIPESFYEHALLCLIIKGADWQMEQVPRAFMTEDMFVLYVKAGRGAWLDRYCEQAGLSKQRILERVIADDIAYLENIFNWHLSATTYAFAQKRYDCPEYEEAWKNITERFARKIARLNVSPSS